MTPKQAQALKVGDEVLTQEDQGGGSLMFLHSGMKASELIKALEAAIEEHGDRKGLLSSGEFPEGAKGVELITKKLSSGYEPEGWLRIYG